LKRLLNIPSQSRVAPRVEEIARLGGFSMFRTVQGFMLYINELV
jgi:hypothetical protein